MSNTNFAIEFSNVNKWFDDFQVLKNINLQVSAGEKIVICGPSGSGKSTLVRCINGLENHGQGIITVHGKQVGVKLKKDKDSSSDVGMVSSSSIYFLT